MGDYFTRHHPPHHHREICATCFSMANILLKIYHKVVHKWENSLLMPKNTVVLTPTHIVVQGSDNFISTYGHKKSITTM